MNSKDFRSLQEAYMEVVENQQLDEGMTMQDFMTARKNRERSEKRKELSPTRRSGIHTPEKKPERDARRDADYGETGHGGALRPKKVRKAKALGELGEQTDIYDIILSHLLDEGYASTEETADKIILNMSESWFESIMELNRYEKETGKDYKTGKEVKKGGTMGGDDTNSKVMRHMHKVMGAGRMGAGGAIQERGKKKERGASTPGPSVTPAQKVAKRRADKKRGEEMQSSRFD